MITGLFFIIQYLCRASFLISHKPKVNVFAESYGKISTTSDFLPAFRNNGCFAEISTNGNVNCTPIPRLTPILVPGKKCVMQKLR